MRRGHVEGELEGLAARVGEPRLQGVPRLLGSELARHLGGGAGVKMTAKLGFRGKTGEIGRRN